MEKKESKSFFHLSDEMMTEHANLDAFTISLILNILFYDKVVIDRAYLFSSKNIRNYLVNSNKHKKGASILEYFTADGVVSLALKKNENPDPELLIKDLKEQFQGVNGIFDGNLYREMDEYFNYVQAGAKNGVILHSDLKVDRKVDNGYFNLMNGLFELEGREILKYLKNPSEHNWFLRNWERAKIWRTHCLNHARERTLAKNLGFALQRSEFFRAIGSEDIFKNKKVEEEDLSDVKKLRANLSIDDASAFNMIITAANQLHHMELSRKFHCTIDYPVVNIVSPLLLKKYFEDSNNGNITKTKSLSFSLDFPSIEKLILIDPVALSDIRKKYINKIQAFSNSYKKYPQEVLPDMRQLLQNYCKEIRKAAKSASSPINVYLEPITNKLVDDGLSDLADGVEDLLLENKNILLKFCLSAALQLIVEVPRKQISSQIELKTSYEIELNLPIPEGANN